MVANICNDGEVDEYEEGCYSEYEDEGEISKAMASKRVRGAGNVTVGETLWEKLVPRDLLRNYEHQLKGTLEAKASGQGAVDDMLHALRVEMLGLRRTRHGAMTHLFLK